MKYFICLLLLMSCNKRKIDSYPTDVKGCEIITIDSCEYIECYYGVADNRIYGIAHKGNCKNPIHKCPNQ